MSQDTIARDPELRAAGTDLSERRRTGISHGPIVDLTPTPAMRAIAWDAAGAATIGASVTIAEIAADAGIAAAYPGVARSAAGLATPQIRHLATLGGNLAQRSRCWYYRNPHMDCLKKGGKSCPARDGNHLYGVAFDLGPCVAPHPSTMAAALLAYDAAVTTDRRSGLSIAQLLGDGTNGAVDHQLSPGETVTSIALPSPVAGERAFYKRAIGRTYAEWPLAELIARVIVRDGRFQLVRLAAGGVAPVPLQLTGAEAACAGAPATAATIQEAARRAVADAKPLPLTRYKLELLSGLVRDLLENAIA